MNCTTTIKVPAIEIQQGGKTKLYSFALDGKKLHDVAQVSRVSRGDTAKIAGYQRPEVLSHIAEIRNYIESEGAILPNAVVVAFDSRVTFEPLDSTAKSNGSPKHGHLIIPTTTGGTGLKSGWIVDGQQRAAAIRDANVERFPLFIIAFVTDNESEQREQFILVNSTKPLPKGLIYELLPSTGAQLSSHLQKRRFPAYLLERMNYDSRSPLHLAIQTPTNPYTDKSAKHRRGVPVSTPNLPGIASKPSVTGFIKDNSILKMLENSLNDGALYRIAVTTDESSRNEAMLSLLFNFWQAVAESFPSAWSKPPTKSRLTHGVGIASMGHIMDAICDRYRDKGIPTSDEFKTDLAVLVSHCSWTDGYWNFGTNNQKKWNELQNISKDIQMVSNHILIKYKNLVWNN